MFKPIISVYDVIALSIFALGLEYLLRSDTNVFIIVFVSLIYMFLAALVATIGENNA